MLYPHVFTLTDLAAFVMRLDAKRLPESPNLPMPRASYPFV